MALPRMMPVLLLMASACPDYGFTPRDVIVDPDGDTDPWVDPNDTGLDEFFCRDQFFEGFDSAIDEACAGGVDTGMFNPVVEWTKRSWDIAPTSHWIMSHPVIVQLTDDDFNGDIDEDDTPDIVVVTFMGEGTYIRALSGDGGDELWSTVTNLQITTGPAAADIDGDGLVEIVALTPDGINCYEHDGQLKWSTNGLSGAISGTSDVASITDMDGDGEIEIIAGRAIMNARGEVIGMGSEGRGGVVEFGNVGTASFAVDVDADGVQEVVVGNALYRKDGSTIWANGQPDGYPAVADFDGDGQAEIAVSGGGRLRLQDTDGTVLWDSPVPGASQPYYGGPPTVADFDGDTEPEIGVAAGSRYSVFEKDGTLLWQQVTNDSSSGNTGSTVFDFEGDGVAEVVYADQTALWVFNGADGSVKLQFEEHSNGTWLEYPVVADLDGDDHAEIVVVHTPQNGSFTGLTVIGDRDETWRKGSTIWNQHAFHITNVDEDGTIPTIPELNWADYNNFRSSDVSSNEGLQLPDLTVIKRGLCEDNCDEGELWVWVQVGNQGMADVNMGALAAIVTLDGGEQQLAEVRVDNLDSGIFHDGVRFVLRGPDWTKVQQIRFHVQSRDKDCNPDNDMLIVRGPFCRELK